MARVALLRLATFLGGVVGHEAFEGEDFEGGFLDHDLWARRRAGELRSSHVARNTERGRRSRRCPSHGAPVPLLQRKRLTTKSNDHYLACRYERHSAGHYEWMATG